MFWLFSIVVGVALFGIACYVGIPTILSEVEAERTDLAHEANRCTRELRRFQA